MYYPVGQKFAQNRSISYGFRDIHTFSFSAKIQDGPPKVAKIEILFLCIGYSCTPLRIKNFAQNRSISYSFRDIHTFSFSAKFKDGRQKWRKFKIFPFP